MKAHRDIVAAVIALVATAAVALATARPAHAEPVADTIRARIEPALPSGLGVAEIFVPKSLANVDVPASAVAVDVPRDLRAGRPSIKVTTRGRVAYVQVAIAPVVEVAVVRVALAAGHTIADDDIAIERRPVGDGALASQVVGATLTRDLDAGAAIGAHDISLPAPLPRGTDVSVDVRRGGLRIRGTGVLELAARPGEPATVRLAATKTLLHGTLVAPATVVIGDAQ